jgi:hypothetical protein
MTSRSAGSFGIFFPIVFWSAQFCIGKIRENGLKEEWKRHPKANGNCFLLSSGKVTLEGDERREHRGTRLEKFRK